MAMFSMKKPVVDLCIVCSDFDRSLAFYRDKLGLEVVLDIEIPESTAVAAGLAPQGFRQVRLRAGQTLIKLMQIEDPPPKPSGEFRAGVRWLTLIIDDVADAVERLREQGVEFLSDPVSAPDAAAVVCARDPDGILIEFVQLFEDEVG
jgi:glyoxylase I family protein